MDTSDEISVQKSWVQNYGSETRYDSPKTSAQESLNYYKKGKDRKPVHSTKVTQAHEYMTLSAATLRKQNLRHERSLSNESLVGSLIRGYTFTPSSCTDSVVQGVTHKDPQMVRFS